MRLIALPAAALLNKLLDAEAWARARLAPFAGETVEFAGGPVPPVRLAIGEGGHITPGDAEPTLTLKLRADALPKVAFADAGEDRLMRMFDVSGNALLANEIMLLARHLRWDVEEDVSGVLGDALAHRVVGTARTVAAWHVEAAWRLAENVIAYAADERRALIRRGELENLAADVAQFRDRVARLAKRLELAGASLHGR